MTEVGAPGDGTDRDDRESGFSSLMRLEVLAGHRRATYVGLPLIFGFGVLDLLSVEDPALVNFFLGLRVGLAVCLIALLRAAQRWPAAVYPAALFGTYLAGGAIALMSALYGGHQSFYYAGMNVVILAIGLLVPFRPLQMLGCSFAVYATYVALSLALDPVPPSEWRWGLFLSNLVFLVATGAVVTIGAYVNRSLRRQAYEATWEQEHANHQLRLANQEIQRSFGQLADKQRELEEAYRYKSQFLDNMSHELRTPLTCVLTPLEGILAGDVRGEARLVFEDMYRASRQLYELINDLLDYSRYGAREVPLRRAPLDLIRLLDDNLRAWSPTARQRGVELRWSPPAEAIVAMLDGHELGKVIRNLVSNAVKFTPRGGHVDVHLSRDDSDLYLEVRDTGIGMDEAALRQLFRPFFQVDGTSTRAVAGTGLGLALVKTIVERHGGAVTVESAPGQGTAMRVRLPFVPVHDTEALSSEPEGSLPPAPIHLGEDALRALAGPSAPASEPDAQPPAASLVPLTPPPAPSPAPAPTLEVLGERAPPEPAEHPLPVAAPLLTEHLERKQRQRARILVIDDQPELLRVIVRVLERDHEVVTAGDGEEGLRRVEETKPDLIVSDLMMPRMNGFELVEALRRERATARLPVLLLTARADGEDRVRGLRRGANDYLTKPFLPDELRERVRNLLQFRHYEGYLTTLNEALEGDRSALEGRLHGLFIDTVRTLVAAIDAKDYYTGGHSERVSFFSVRIAEHLRLPRPLLRTIELGALLHDVGKIGIPDNILNKPGRLSDEEIAVIREHTVFGGKILEKSPELAELRRFALHHHERWDGRGYPDGLRAEEIPQSVRVVSVADCWDAMVSDRVYRPGMDPKIAAAKVQQLRGNQFDPEVVEALLEVWPALEVPPHLRPLRPMAAPSEVRAGPRVSECGEVYHLHEA
jgi:response regulator RpfG family c-di-GMP phosphodiesterase/signal transduction histidine kinase